MSTTDNLSLAASVYIKRKTWRAAPDGCADHGGRWYPSDAEKQPCCAGIRPPSGTWPNSLKKHCCGAAHVAKLFNVNELELKRAARGLAEGAS